MSLKFGLLGFLSNEDMSGYELEKLFNKSIGFFWKAQISQMYRDLKNMETSGWVTSNEVIQSGKPNKKVFSITTDGQEALQEWLIGYDIKGDFEVRVGILVRMFFASKRPKEETIALLERFQDKCEATIAGLAYGCRSLEESRCDDLHFAYAKSTLSYGEKYYTMQRDWAMETVETLKGLEE